MEIYKELEGLAGALRGFCEGRGLKFAWLAREEDAGRAPRLGGGGYLFAAQTGETLEWGHEVETVEGGRYFLRVRTPFAASSSLKFVRVRSYAVVAMGREGLGAHGLERETGGAGQDWQEVAAEAVAAATGWAGSEADFMQVEGTGPAKVQEPGWMAFRGTFFTGEVVGTVGAPDPAKNVEVVWVL
jgi:hypothetical protein